MAVKNIAVIGAGTMGRDIAHAAAAAGYEVILMSRNETTINKATSIINKNLQKAIERGKMTAELAAETLGRIKTTNNLAEAAASADLVIENVPEVMETKQEVFRQLDELCPPHTVLATDTSAKSISEIASATKRVDKVVGMHFFNPAYIMKLVEINRGMETSDETYQIAAEVAQKMGKESICVNESPGFVVTRLNAVLANEAFKMAMEGVASPADIDKACKLGLNHPMGPFELIDLVGLDTRVRIMEELQRVLGEAYRPSPLMVKYVKAGRLGKKVGKGVYLYEK
ncbi:MAG: 3-hydroxyacyl-CoA dehydrogenase NAD-binding domain-containing protein [Syntrophomonas sp.]|nr:3-hydroxyacyl-CoA dehydrogenase NAD-binding domain-containing protein [Syntrophomonas sp.]